MGTQKSHLKKCEELMLTYSRFFKKHQVIFAQIRNGNFVVIATSSAGNKYKNSFGTHSELIYFLDKIAESI